MQKLTWIMVKPNMQSQTMLGHCVIVWLCDVRGALHIATVLTIVMFLASQNVFPFSSSTDNDLCSARYSRPSLSNSNTQDASMHLHAFEMCIGHCHAKANGMRVYAAFCVKCIPLLLLLLLLLPLVLATATEAAAGAVVAVAKRRRRQQWSSLHDDPHIICY